MGGRDFEIPRTQEIRTREWENDQVLLTRNLFSSSRLEFIWWKTWPLDGEASWKLVTLRWKLRAGVRSSVLPDWLDVWFCRTWEMLAHVSVHVCVQRQRAAVYVSWPITCLACFEHWGCAHTDDTVKDTTNQASSPLDSLVGRQGRHTRKQISVRAS